MKAKTNKDIQMTKTLCRQLFVVGLMIFGLNGISHGMDQAQYKPVMDISLGIHNSISEMSHKIGLESSDSSPRKPHPQKNIAVQYKTGKLTDDLIHALSQSGPTRLVNVSQIITAGFSVEEAFNGFFRHVKLDIRRTPGMLRSFTSNTNLITLSLRANYIGNEGAKILADVLAENSILTTLNLDYNLIDATGMKDLVRGLIKNSTLTALTLGYNMIGDDGAGYLAEVLKKNEKLKTLNLEFNMITDKGAGYLAEAWSENTSLIDLNLFDNFIFAQGARLLTGVMKNKTTCTNLNLECNFIDIELEIDIKEVMERCACSKTHKVARPSMRGRFRLMVQNYYSKHYETEEDQDEQWVTDLLAKRLKIIGSLKKLHDQPSESPGKYLQRKTSLERNQIGLMSNLKNLNSDQLKEIFGKKYNYRKLDADHAIKVALALTKRIPEDEESLRKLEAVIEKVQSWKQTEGHVLILGKTSFLKSENDVLNSESDNSDSENGDSDDKVISVYNTSEKPASISDDCVCRLF